MSRTTFQTGWKRTVRIKHLLSDDGSPGEARRFEDQSTRRVVTSRANALAGKGLVCTPPMPPVVEGAWVRLTDAGREALGVTA